MSTNLIKHYVWQRILTVSVATACAAILAGCSDSVTSTAEAHDHDHDHGHQHSHSVVATGGLHSHGTSGKTCFICDPAKRDVGRLWCREHGRYEDRCWICHPELEDKSRPYCSEHFLYEDECFICHPELQHAASAMNSTSSYANHDHTHDRGQSHMETDLADLFCHEHGVPEIECAICQPELAAGLLPGADMKVRLPSPEAARKAGIQTAKLSTATTAPRVRAICEAQYNQNALAKVTPLVSGMVRNVYHNAGDYVEAGTALVELHSAEIAKAKSDYLGSLVELEIRKQALERATRLNDQRIAAERDFLEARAGQQKAQLDVKRLRQQLLNYGITEDAIAKIEAEQDTSATLLVRAPFTGTLIDRKAVMGEAVQAGEELFAIADLSTHWLVLSIPSAEGARVRVGQTVDAEFPEMPGIIIRGKITWVASAIDPRTRMLTARALVQDDGDLIKSGLFGTAEIIVGDDRTATLAPKSSVQRYEGNAYVFVQDEGDLFALRRVDAGAVRGNNIEILSGLEPQEAVVTQGSFIVMSEFLKSRLGAGCAGH